MKKRNNVLAWFEHILNMNREDIRVCVEFWEDQPEHDFNIALNSLLALAED